MKYRIIKTRLANYKMYPTPVYQIESSKHCDKETWECPRHIQGGENIFATKDEAVVLVELRGRQVVWHE